MRWGARRDDDWNRMKFSFNPKNVNRMTQAMAVAAMAKQTILRMGRPGVPTGERVAGPCVGWTLKCRFLYQLFAVRHPQIGGRPCSRHCGSRVSLCGGSTSRASKTTCVSPLAQTKKWTLCGGDPCYTEGRNSIQIRTRGGKLCAWQEYKPQRGRRTSPVPCSWTAAVFLRWTPAVLFEPYAELLPAMGRFELTLRCQGDVEVDYHHTVEGRGHRIGPRLCRRPWRLRRHPALMAPLPCHGRGPCHRGAGYQRPGHAVLCLGGT